MDLLLKLKYRTVDASCNYSKAQPCTEIRLKGLSTTKLGLALDITFSNGCCFSGGGFAIFALKDRNHIQNPGRMHKTTAIVKSVTVVLLV